MISAIVRHLRHVSVCSQSNERRGVLPSKSHRDLELVQQDLQGKFYALLALVLTIVSIGFNTPKDIC